MYKTALTASVFTGGNNFYVGLGSAQYKVSKTKYLEDLNILNYLKQPRTSSEVDLFLTKNGYKYALFKELLEHRQITTDETIFSKHDTLNHKNELFLSTIFTNPDRVIEKVHDTTFLVVGCGGIGNFSGYALNTMTPRDIYLIDGDKIEQSNLNRQFLFTTNDIGEFKTDILKREFEKRNKSAQVHSISQYATSSILDKVLSRCDPQDTIMLLSGDTFSALTATIQSAVKYQIPFLNVGYLNDIACVGPFYIPNVSACPLCHNTFAAENDNSDLKNIEDKINNGAQSPSGFVNNGLASSMGIMDILNFIAGDLDKVNSINKRVGISSQNFTRMELLTSIDEHCKYCGRKNDQ